MVENTGLDGPAYICGFCPKSADNKVLPDLGRPAMKKYFLVDIYRLLPRFNFHFRKLLGR